MNLEIRTESFGSLPFQLREICKVYYGRITISSVDRAEPYLVQVVSSNLTSFFFYIFLNSDRIRVKYKLFYERSDTNENQTFL